MANIEQYKDRIFNMICPTVPPGDLETFDNAFLIFCISWLDETPVWNTPVEKKNYTLIKFGL